MTATLTPPAPPATQPPSSAHATPRRPVDSTLPLEQPIATGGREAYIDAFRGFVMLCLISRGFGFIELQKVEGLHWLHRVTMIFDHIDWAGRTPWDRAQPWMTPWDMIQPWFMFIVGVAMPFAFAKRVSKGDSWGLQFGHAIKRALLLLFWAHFAQSVSKGRPIVEFINVLSQIAFGYLIAFFVLGQRLRVQAAVAIGLLLFHTVLHLYWQPTGVKGPWVKEANVGWYLDKLILGKNWDGGYATINFITSAANIIAGVMAGELLRRTFRDAPGRKAGSADVKWKAVILLASGVTLIAAGLLLSLWVPQIKKIWTSSFALVSIGISLLTLLAFYLVHRKWPNVKWGLFIVIGANPIFLYLANMMFGGQLRRMIGVYTGWIYNNWLANRMPGRNEARAWWASAHPEYWLNFINAWGSLLILIFIAYWLYRRKIFIKV